MAASAKWDSPARYLAGARRRAHTPMSDFEAPPSRHAYVFRDGWHRQANAELCRRGCRLADQNESVTNARQCRLPVLLTNARSARARLAGMRHPRIAGVTGGDPCPCHPLSVPIKCGHAVPDVDSRRALSRDADMNQGGTLT